MQALSGYLDVVQRHILPPVTPPPAWRTRLLEATRDHGALKKLADAAKMKSQQLKKVIAGGDPRLSTLQRLAAGMGISIDALLAEPRPEGSGHDDRPEGSAVLARLVNDAATKGGTWQADVANAIATLAVALKRESDRSQSGQVAQPPRR